MVLDMQARLLLDMLGKGIESALVNPSALVIEPWRTDGETILGTDPEAMAVDPALVSSIQVYLPPSPRMALHVFLFMRWKCKYEYFEGIMQCFHLKSSLC